MSRALLEGPGLGGGSDTTSLRQGRGQRKNLDVGNLRLGRRKLRKFLLNGFCVSVKQGVRSCVGREARK